MASLGIDDNDILVAYDDQGGVTAARLVWMLRATGHDAALLDGGLAGYDGPLERGPARSNRSPGSFSSRPWPRERLAEMEDTLDPANLVVDARAPERYQGLAEPVDPRAGHIPGAINLPCRQNLDKNGRFLPVAQLRARFASAGIGGARPVVCYCGSGVTACHNLLAIEHSGLGAGRLYPGSWSEYSASPDRPIET